MRARKWLIVVFLPFAIAMWCYVAFKWMVIMLCAAAPPELLWRHMIQRRYAPLFGSPHRAAWLLDECTSLHG